MLGDAVATAPLAVLALSSAALLISALGVFRQGRSAGMTALADELKEARGERDELRAEVKMLRRENMYLQRRALGLNGDDDK